MTLNEDLIRQARHFTPNLSETVEGLLADFVADAEAKAAQVQQQIEDHIAATEAFIAKHGVFGDEYGIL